MLDKTELSNVSSAPCTIAEAASRSEQTKVPHRSLQTGLVASRKGLSLVKDTEVRARVMLSTRNIKLLASLLETTSN